MVALRRLSALVVWFTSFVLAVSLGIKKAIQVCVNRFDDETKQAFLELYDKVDADFDLTATGEKVYVDQEAGS